MDRERIMEYSSENMVELEYWVWKTENFGNSRDQNPVGFVFHYGVWMDNVFGKHVTSIIHPVLVPNQKELGSHSNQMPTVCRDQKENPKKLNVFPHFLRPVNVSASGFRASGPELFYIQFPSQNIKCEKQMLDLDKWWLF